MEANQKINLKTNLTNHTEDLIDHYWYTISYLSALIKASELKAGLILSFYGIVLNFVYQGAQSIGREVIEDRILLSFVIIWMLITGLSIFFCIRCFIPKIEGNYSKNMFFFKDIISHFGPIKEFSKSFFKMSINEDELFLQLGEQVFIVSKIADWKFKNVKRAINFLAIGLVVFALGGLYVFFLFV
jgi:hypothetical protein